ncbi:aminopeptidase [Clostridiaceae bacterium M8S5]|nr:aminopeptidase [Clostridiaceae bacterium M8S5]
MDKNKKKTVLWDTYSEQLTNETFSFGEKYRKFMSKCKTERECVKNLIVEAKEYGYRDLETIIKNKENLKPGDKVYCNNRDKSLALFHIGSRPFEDGLRILGAHVDSPRIDLKQNPLYEESGFAMFKTHYYGGIKKFQWVTLPLALHGVVAKKDGTLVDVVIGEDSTDPVIGISDVLPHLSKNQNSKKISEAFTGENLNICVGSIPLKSDDDKEENKVKKNILKILKDKYDIEEDDFLSSEFEAVPAGEARDYGLDNSMILAYGHDDRICSYTSFEAMMRLDSCDKTCVTLLVDKEEIGSVGASGMCSKFFENKLAEIMELCGEYSELRLRRSLANSKMLSSDVNAGFDPNFPDVYEKNNSSYFGKGLVLCKYTGARGKSGSNDASPEYIAELRKLYDKHDIKFQMAELGKVDQGGGGTIAYILAEYDMDVIDAGIAVHNMHAPYEVASKIDIYEAVRAYHAFLKEI